MFPFHAQSKAWEPSVKVETSSRNVEMSASAEASDLLKRLAEPAPAGAHIETLIRDVALKMRMHSAARRRSGIARRRGWIRKKWTLCALLRGREARPKVWSGENTRNLLQGSSNSSDAWMRRRRTWAARKCLQAATALARLACWIAPWITDEPPEKPRVHMTMWGL
jgi:hypothetical protein